MARQLGKAIRSRIAFQSDFATYAEGPWTPSLSYQRSDPASPDLLDDPKLGDSATANDRDPTAPLIGRPKTALKRTVPVSLTETPFWLKGAFGAPTTTGEDDFTHVFKSGADTLPFLTINDMLAAGKFRKIRGVFVNGFTLQAQKEQAFPQFQLDLMCRDFALDTDWLDGDVNAMLADQRPAAWKALVKWNGTAIGSAQTSQIVYSNNGVNYDVLDGGDFAANIDPMLAAVSGNMQLRTDGDTYHALAQAGTVGSLELSYALPSAPTTRAISFALNYVRLSTDGQAVDGGGEMTATFNIRGEQGVSAGQNAVTVTVKNGVAAADYA